MKSSMQALDDLALDPARDVFVGLGSASPRNECGSAQACEPLQADSSQHIGQMQLRAAGSCPSLECTDNLRVSKLEHGDLEHMPLPSMLQDEFNIGRESLPAACPCQS